MDLIYATLTLGIVLCTLVATLTYYSSASFIIKLITLPFTVITSIFVIYTLVSLTGAPIEKFPEHKWVYLGHQPIDEGKSIILWTWDKEIEDFRLYKFPYDRETQKKLNTAKQSLEDGTGLEGEFKKEDGGERSLSIDVYNPQPNKNYVK